MGSFWSHGQTRQLPASATERPCSMSSRGPVTTTCCTPGKDELPGRGCRAWSVGWQGLGQPHTVTAAATLLHCGSAPLTIAAPPPHH